ncbi:hypothetical protein F2Q69_00026872 [Brassica cretica]|uniref:Uncharacterized protein n=1 Tax=Brassica cretica TaxID=69181 RepID=A0A8S9S1N6_BRACR|nr:hypothetical protein F2Q69_00026872 [Brassica cretica]
MEKCSRPRSASAHGVPNPSSDVCDLRAAPTRDLFLVRDSIRQLASDDQGVPDQATKDIRDPIEATRSIPARVPFVSSSRLNSFGGPIQQSSKCDDPAPLLYDAQLDHDLLNPPYYVQLDCPPQDQDEESQSHQYQLQ